MHKVSTVKITVVAEEVNSNVHPTFDPYMGHALSEVTKKETVVINRDRKRKSQGDNAEIS